MSYEMEGTLIMRANTVQVSDKFQKREFAIETSGEYPQKIKFQLKQDKVSLVDGINKGDKLKVYFNVDGYSWEKNNETNYGVNLSAWKIEVVESTKELIEDTTKKVAEAIDADNGLPF